MKRTLSILFASVLFSATAVYAQNTQETKAPQDTKTDKTSAPATTEDAQRLTTGEITKIDTKKKILTVREVSQNQPGDSGQAPNVNRRGGMGGGRRRGGGVGYPGRRPTSTAQNQGKEFKVTVTDQTAIRDKVTTIGFDLLRVGDHISVQGLPKGKGPDLQATQITVN